MREVIGVLAIAVPANICRNAGTMSSLLNWKTAPCFVSFKAERISSGDEGESVETEARRWSIAASGDSKELNLLQSPPAAAENPHRSLGYLRGAMLQITGAEVCPSSILFCGASPPRFGVMGSPSY